MANTILRDVTILGALAVALAYAAENRETVYDMLGLVPVNNTEETEAKATEHTVQRPSVTPLTGQAVSIPKSRTDGQFWTDAKVNGGFVHFLVDTGASSVALTPEDARRAGIRLSTLNYNVPVSTAGGENVAAYVTLKQISVGSVSVRNVKALVVPEGLSTSLLGMTYLGELQKVEATPNALILRR